MEAFAQKMRGIKFAKRQKQKITIINPTKLDGKKVSRSVIRMSVLREPLLEI